MSRKYELRYTNMARKGIKSLDDSVRRRVRKAIEALADDPRPSGSVQIKGHTGIWRVRVGDYRILLEYADLSIEDIRVEERGRLLPPVFARR